MTAINFHSDDGKSELDGLTARLIGRTIAGVLFNHKPHIGDWFDIVMTLDNGEVLQLSAGGCEAEYIAGSLK